MQFETILPFLRPIEHLILDPNISEIMVNADSRIFIEKRGQLLPVPGITISEQALCAAVKNIARRLGDDISEAKAILDSRLPDGSRAAAVLPPCSIDGITAHNSQIQHSAFHNERPNYQRYAEHGDSQVPA